MAGMMLLRAPASLDDDQFEWSMLSNDGTLDGDTGSGTAHEAALAARGRAVTVVVPGSDASLTGATVPGRNRARALAAIPFALEEGLVEDVAAYHFVAGRADGTSHYPVAVVLRNYFDRLLATLSDAGIVAQQAVCEPQLLPDNPWCVVIDADRAAVRLGPTRGFAIEMDELPLLLETARDEASLADDDEDEGDTDAGDIPLIIYGECAELELPGYQIVREPYTLPMEVLARGLRATPLNLLQHDYRRSSQIGRVLRRYRPSLALAAVLAVLLAVAGFVDYRQLGQREQQLQGEIEAAFRGAFPEVKRVVNPRAQMRQRLKQLRGDQTTEAGFLALLAQSAATLASAEQVTVNAISYRRGRLELDVEAGQLQALDTMKRGIAAAGEGKVSVQSAKSEQNRVRGRLRVEADDS